MMKRKPAAKTGGKKPVSKKKSGKMPPELLERFKKKSGAKKDGNTAGMKKGGMPAGKAGAKAEAKGMKRGADKKKGAARGSGMMGMKKGSSAKK